MKKIDLLLKYPLAMGLVILLVLMSTAAGLAFEGRAGENVVVETDQVIPDDLYVAGDAITINGTIQGDLVATGGTINVEGTVEGDLIAAGRSVTVNGTVNDDVRLAGAALQLGPEAHLADDLLAGGYSLQTAAGSLIDGDLLFGGNLLLLAGEVTGGAWAGATGLELRGQIGGDLNADVGTPEGRIGFSPFVFQPDMPPTPAVTAGLTVTDQAGIGGDLTYRSRTPVEIQTEAVGGEVIYQREERTQTEAQDSVIGTLSWFLDQLRNFVALLLVGLLLVWLAPRFIRRAAGALQARPLPSLGWGLVSLFVLGLAGLIILVATIFLAILLGWVTLDSLVWVVIGFGLLALVALVVLFAFAAAFIAQIVVSYLGGRLILARINPDWAASRVWPLLLGLLLLIILTAIPYLGGLISLVVILLGLGALWLLARERLVAAPA